MLKFTALVLVAAQLLSSVQSAADCQPPEKDSLSNITSVTQEQSKWCWAAVGKMTLDYFNISFEQCNLASKATPRQCSAAHPQFPIDCCANRGDPACDFPCWPPLRSRDKFGLDSKRTSSGVALKYEDLQKQIHCKRSPVAASWLNPSGGHIVLAIGYLLIEGNPQVEILDPQQGRGYRIIPYSEYAIQPGYQSHWRDYYDIHKVSR